METWDDEGHGLILELAMDQAPSFDANRD